MSLLNDSPEVFDLDSGVDSGGVDRLVSEKLLDVPQLRALLQQMSGEGVTLMPGPALASLCRVPDYAGFKATSRIVLGVSA
jgi:hypothetical protein